MKKLILSIFLAMLAATGPVLGADEEPPPQPDLWAAEIIVLNGMTLGPNNQVKVLVENLVKDSEITGPIKVELVVIGTEPSDRASYFAEVNEVKYGKKTEVLFTGVAAKDPESVRLLSIVDPDKVVAESNEVNNRRLYKVWLKKAPETATPEANPEAAPEAPEASPETAPEAPEASPETTPEEAPETTPEETPESVSDPAPENEQES